MNAEAAVRLLIVDDEPAQMQALCDTLAEHGFDTHGVDSGPQALAALREGRYELLLADLMMPGMSGIELLREALAIDEQMAAVIMTGEGTIGSAVDAMRSGALDYILKPFRLSTVLPVLNRALMIRRLRLDNAGLLRRVQEHAAELQAANHELDAFTRSASHDLRAPLHVIQGFAALVLERSADLLPAEQADWLRRIEHAAQQMSQLIDDLMRLSRLGRQALIVRPLDMGRLASELVGELRQAQPQRDVDWHIGALPPAHGDAALLRQVYMNLLSNALKFTRNCRPARIELGHGGPDGGGAYFVRDNGPGFDMARASRLFEAFQRLHRADEYEGSGVGLSIVQRIVQRHGGRIWAKAAPGQGATFYFTLSGDAG